MRSSVSHLFALSVALIGLALPSQSVRAAPEVESGTIYDAAATAMRELDQAKDFFPLAAAHGRFVNRFQSQIRSVEPSWYDRDALTRAAGDKAKEVIEDAAVSKLPSELQKAVEAMGKTWAARVALGVLDTENVASNWQELQLLREQVWKSYDRNFKRLLKEKGYQAAYDKEMSRVVPALERLNFDVQNNDRNWLRKP